ncbi:LytR/AlgR family response regulator transcription factor [Fibrivirga algicola]|uniref:LytTR family transcriptional regulator n=1 Tax=Fibrivirga algicola TaxID=2950420 RepID=A0ABX0QFN8_9BACT|nr:LytTR family DNA-binding domain-containing protein [Fibrivirga algicola]NID11044.1 LytTR family transcriptional regulator [Fibrivirga algicola]
MIERINRWLNRPLAEDFSWQNQGRLAMMAAVYIFVLLNLLNIGRYNWPDRLFLHGLFGLACGVSSLLVNLLAPRLFPGWYDEDKWTVGRHILHSLFVLLGVTVGNQLVLVALKLPGLPFLSMYALVTGFGFFPILLGVMAAERRRLSRNLAHAQQLNKQLGQLHRPNVPTTPVEPVLPRGILLTGETGNEQLSLLPNQLIYVEAVGNYVEVHWLNFMFPQKTLLRSTLKDVEAAVAHNPQFFRCHRSYLINLRAVSHTTGNSRGYQLTMSGSKREIPVSRTYLAAFDAHMAGQIL